MGSCMGPHRSRSHSTVKERSIPQQTAPKVRPRKSFDAFPGQLSFVSPSKPETQRNSQLLMQPQRTTNDTYSPKESPSNEEHRQLPVPFGGGENLQSHLPQPLKGGELVQICLEKPRVDWRSELMKPRSFVAHSSVPHSKLASPLE